MSLSTKPRPYWTSMTSYFLVTTGAVVGIGNIIRFPFFVYEFGGAFILLYILCELLISIPILFAELLIGRRGKQNPVGSFAILAMETGVSRAWRWIGWLCFIILFLSLASYTVSATFPVAYFWDIFSFITAHGLNDKFYHPDHLQITYHFPIFELSLLLFLLATMIVILRGINRGLELISWITVPLYFIILLCLAIYSCSVGSFNQAISYLFTIKSSASFTTILFAALTYAFFKLNVGMGSMIVYGSYLPYSVPIGRSTLLIVCFDAIISLLSYFVIYPLYSPSHEIVSSVHFYQDILFFFSHTKNGNVVALLFLLATIIAAWTPTIAMAESATVTLIERFNLSRRTATLLIFAGACLTGTMIVFSHQMQDPILLFHRWTIAGAIDGLTSNIMIPISAFLTAIFAGWILKRSITASELGFRPFVYSLWRFLVRFVSPIFIVITVLMLVNLI